MKWAAHVDWITTTWRAGAIDLDAALTDSMYSWACRYLRGGRAANPLLTWAWQGYIGWQAGTLCWGERVDGFIVRVSGDLAAAYWQDERPIGHNISRIDLCVDVWHETGLDDIIALHKDTALEERARRPGRPYKVAHVNSFGNGDTLYLGSRASEIYVRIYNKERESDGEERYIGCVRYEVEFKDSTANETVHGGGVRLRGARGIAKAVASVLLGRGVVLPGDVLLSPSVAHIARRVDTPDEAKLEWLRRGVAPSVKHLLNSVGRDAILDALGLGD